jgi:hypothetical protein
MERVVGPASKSEINKLQWVYKGSFVALEAADVGVGIDVYCSQETGSIVYMAGFLTSSLFTNDESKKLLGGIEEEVKGRFKVRRLAYGWRYVLQFRPASYNFGEENKPE